MFPARSSANAYSIKLPISGSLVPGPQIPIAPINASRVFSISSIPCRSTFPTLMVLLVSQCILFFRPNTVSLVRPQRETCGTHPP